VRFPYVLVFEKGGIQISLIGYRGIAFPFLILHTVSKESFFDAFVCMSERKSGECSKKNTIGQESVMYSEEFYILSRQIE